MKILKTILQSRLFCVFLIIITSLITVFRIAIKPKLYYTEQDKEVIGVIEKITRDNKKITMLIKAKEKLQGIYYLSNQKTSTIPNLEIGDKVKILGELTTPTTPTTANQFDYSFYLKKQGIYHLIIIAKINKIENASKISYKVRNILNEKITHPYIQAFLLGNDEKIKEEVKISYQENGISHLLAISGMHFYLIASIILKILRRTKITNKKQYLIAFVLIFVYSSFLDINASILRGMLFFFLFSLNRVWNLELTKPTLILFTIIITILINPYFLTDVAFWYSFVISIGLLYFLETNGSYWKNLWTSSILSFLLSIPISLYYFYQINILSVFYNIFYIPYVTFVVFPLTILTFFIPIIGPIYQLSIMILEESSLFLAKIKIGIFVFPKVNIFMYLFEFIILIVLLKKKNKKVIFLVILLFSGHYFSVYFHQDFMKIIDVGQGDSILLFSKGRTALIDTGGKINFNNLKSNTITKYTTIPLLKSLGIKKINFLFLTHGDMDHMGEAIYLMNHFKIEKIYINLGTTSFLEKELLKTRKIKKSKQDSSYKLANFTIYQINKSWKDENNSSSVYYIIHPNLTILSMGDATIETEKYLLNNYNLNIDILKIGHHGSKTSTGNSFLQATTPDLALISVGRNNRFNHPNREVLNRLIENEIPYLTTRDSGTITIFPNNKIIREDKKE